MVITETEEIKNRFMRLREHCDTAFVESGFLRVSEEPLFSNQYANCCGVALLKPGLGGLTHHFLKREVVDPHIYLFDILFMMDAIMNGVEGVRAAVIGGDRNHFRILKERLEQEYRIPVIGEYCDGWMDGERLNPKNFRRSPEQWEKAHKSLLVIPKTQEVLLYGQNIGCRKLI